MMLFGRALYAALGATGPALEAASPLLRRPLPRGRPVLAVQRRRQRPPRGRQRGVPGGRGAAGGGVTLAASPLVIFGAGPVPGFGVAGAAWASSAYNVAMAAVLLRAVWAPARRRGRGFRSLVPRWRYASGILRIAVPSAASTLLTNLTFIILTALVAPFGTEAIAGLRCRRGRLEYLLIPSCSASARRWFPWSPPATGRGTSDVSAG